MTCTPTPSVLAPVVPEKVAAPGTSPLVPVGKPVGAAPPRMRESSDAAARCSLARARMAAQRARARSVASAAGVSGRALVPLGKLGMRGLQLCVLTPRLHHFRLQPFHRRDELQ